jgi:hypothetical protein
MNSQLSFHSFMRMMPQEHEMTVDFDTATDRLVSSYLFASLCPSRNSFDWEPLSLRTRSQF